MQRRMTYFRVPRSAAAVGTRLRGCFWLLVSGPERARRVLSLRARRPGGGAEVARPGACVQTRNLGPLSAPGSVHGVDGASPASVPLAPGPRGTVQAHRPSFSAHARGRVPARHSARDARLGARGPSRAGGGGSSGETLTVRRGMDPRFPAASWWVSSDVRTFQSQRGAERGHRSSLHGHVQELNARTALPPRPTPASLGLTKRPLSPGILCPVPSPSAATLYCQPRTLNSGGDEGPEGSGPLTISGFPKYGAVFISRPLGPR